LNRPLLLRAVLTPSSPPPERGRDRERVNREFRRRNDPLPNPPLFKERERTCVIGFVCAIAILGYAISTSAHAAGNVTTGRRKALQCQTCHGLDGLSKLPEAPNLGGQPEPYLVKSLNDFRQGVRKNDMMSLVVQQLSDQDVADLAAFYAAIEVTTKPPK
jgi:cytochrome c553